MVCTVEGCEKAVKVLSRGLCGQHYERWRVHGDPTVILTAYGVPVDQRLRSKVMVNPETGCWEWLGQIDTYGYAIVKVDGKSRKAHRVAYELFVGPIPEGLDIDHVWDRGCRVKHCVNPDHLEPVTTGENQRRGRNGVLKTTCRNGHPYDDDHVRLNTNGARTCVVCTRQAQSRYRAKKRSAVR